VQWSTVALNKNSPIPLYYQLDQLSLECVLSEQVAISRMTARQAVAYLVREGALVVKQGVGTFIAEPKLTYDALHLLGFTEEAMRRGGVVTSRVLEQAIVTPPPTTMRAASSGSSPARR